jgi:hypothetical protein
MSRTFSVKNPRKKTRKPLTANHKCAVGPGGINCNCCTHGYHPTAFKKLTRKLERVYLKRDLYQQFPNH